MSTTRNSWSVGAAAIAIATCSVEACPAMAAGPITIDYTGTITAGDNAYAGRTVTLEPIARGERVILKIDGHSVAVYFTMGGPVRRTMRDVVLHAKRDGTAEIAALRDDTGHEVKLRLIVSRYERLVAARRSPSEEAAALTR